jgi:hypothetical protein
VLRPEGRLYLTSIVTGTTFGDWWAKVLHGRGEIAAPFSAEQLVEELGDVGFTSEFRTQGSGVYVAASKRPAPC